MPELNDTSKTVADNPDPADKQTGKDEGAPADRSLDEILSELDQEYDKGTQPDDEPKAPAKASKSDDDLRRDLDAVKERLFWQDVDAAVGTVKTELGDDLNVSDRAVRGVLNELYNEDPRFKKAFDNRSNNPTAYQRVLRAAAREVRKDFGDPVDRQTTSDRDALAAAAAGSKSANIVEDEAPDFATMSDADYEDWKAKHG